MKMFWNKKKEEQQIVQMPQPQSMTMEITDEKPGLGIIRVRRLEVKSYSLDVAEEKLNKMYKKVMKND